LFVTDGLKPFWMPAKAGMIAFRIAGNLSRSLMPAFAGLTVFLPGYALLQNSHSKTCL
jgi:hypothetical protein